MKIGILTFHIANNYGAVLQAYGLQETLKELGHNVDIIDYRNTFIVSKQDYFSLKNTSVMKFIYRLVSMNALHKKINVFKSFRKEYLNISREIYYSGPIPKGQYDLLIVGSDQVWSPNITGGLDPMYWGASAGDTPIITYAASAGDLSLLTQDDKHKVQRWVNKFHNISVRETKLNDFLKNECNIDSSIVLDPTLLSNKENFDKICAPRCIEEPYLLVYNVESTPNLKKIAYEIAKKRGLKIVKVGLPTMKEKHYWDNSLVITPTVPQLLSLFKHADYVVALSFHGTVFSLMFEKEFVSLKSWNMARVQTLLNTLNLSERIVEDSNIEHFDKIDYTKVKVELETKREKSLSYLLSSISTLYKSQSE